jgi:predicted GIY-YIG superfamily endonuclease
MCYVGKTKDPKARVSNHKSKSIASNIYLYQTIRDNGGWSAFQFEIIETKEMDKDDARQHEQDLYNIHKATMNTLTPNGNPRAVVYYAQNADRLRTEARERYTKTKTDWKHPIRSNEQTKATHLKRVEKTGNKLTALTCEKYNITLEEFEMAMAKYLTL